MTMKKLKAAIIFVISIVILVIVIMNILTIINPLRKSQAGIEKDILRLTPIGMHIDDVIKIIEGREKWNVRYIDYEMGYAHPYRLCTDDDYIVGNKSIRASIGDYKVIFVPANVTVLWGFDYDGKLIEIYVWKSFDVI